MKGNTKMKTVKSTLACIVTLAGMGALMSIGCTAEAPSDTTDAVSEEANNAVETLTMDVDNGIAHASKLSASLVHVDLYDLQGNLEFSVDIRLGGEGEETIKWTLFPAPGVEPISKSWKNAVVELPDLETAIAGATYMQKNVTNAMAQGEAYDNYGCDLPYTWVTSCSSKGKCCDVHDACYAKYGCTASSWYGYGPVVCSDVCNANVVYCIFNTNPGPSSCCSAGNCGQPR